MKIRNIIWLSIIIITAYSCTCELNDLLEKKDIKASGRIVLSADSQNLGIIKLEGRDHVFGSFLYRNNHGLKLNQLVSFNIKSSKEICFAYDIVAIEESQIIPLTDDIINLSCINWHNRLKHPNENKHIKGHIYPETVRNSSSITLGNDTYNLVEFSHYNNDTLSPLKDSVYVINTFNYEACNDTVYVHFQEENHTDENPIIQQISCSEMGLH